MKRALQLSLALIILTAVVSPIWAQGGGLRYSITVSKFENRSGWHGYWDLGDAWGMVMTDLLNQTGINLRSLNQSRELKCLTPLGDRRTNLTRSQTHGRR